MADRLLTINAGSSSIKFAVFEPGAGRALVPASRGQLDGIGTHPRLRVRDGGGSVLADQTFAPAEVPDAPAALARLGGWLAEHFGGVPPIAVGHRVVHGGPAYTAPVVVDDAVYAVLERLIPLAPLHQPGGLLPIRTIRERFPRVPQVACFDTAFHRGHPEVADRYALPDRFYQEGVRRFGFHGLSYEYIARRLPAIAPEVAAGAVVIAHLGSGSSMCAIREGRSVESTMGFTALDGLPMGTRCGQLDPGVVLYLLEAKGFTAKDIERLLYHESGLLGLSGISNDMRDLLASADSRARLALDYFVHRAACEIGALAGAMGGLDGLVFTAGVGENSPDIRGRIAARAGWLGLRLDEAANRAGGPRITRPDSRVSAWVIPTDEERMIAEHTLACTGR